MASRPLFIALSLVALITAIRLTGTVDSDVAWQLWIAGRLHEGADLYRDIMETNPPLWFWMAVPVERLSTLLNLRIESVLIVAIGAIGALSLAATSRFLRHVKPSHQAMFLCAAAVMLCAMPWMHVGQREQIVLICTLPYAALISARSEGRAISSPLVLAIGFGAALGFALKHYFLIAPLLLELWLAVGARRQWRPFRAEIIAIASVGAAYAVAIVLFEPDFVTRILPLLQLAYGAFGAPTLAYMLGPFALVSLILLGVIALNGRLLIAGRKAPLASALGVAAVGFAAAYFIQFKGWPYHTIPMTGFAALAMVALLAESIAPLRLLRLAAPALFGLPLFLAAQEQFRPGLPSPDLRAAVATLKPGDPVGFLTTETAIPWSVTLQGGYRYPSRYNGFWMLPAVLGGRGERLEALGRQVVSETVADYRCMPPRRIIIARPQPGEVGFDILPFFERDPEFRKLLGHYRVTSRNSLETYELTSPVLPAGQAACIRRR